MKRHSFGKLTNQKMLSYVSYLTKQTQEFHWVIAWSKVGLGINPLSIKDIIIFMVKILSSPWLTSEAIFRSEKSQLC